MIEINLEGKTALVAGVQNEYSLGWPIAKKLVQAGARVAFSYQGERNRPMLEKLTTDFSGTVLEQCDVNIDAELERLFARIKGEFGGLDYLVHSIAFTPRETQERPFVETSREGWRIALETSAYSLVALAQHAAPLMRPGGSIVCLTYYASQKVVPMYNVMGVAKAALEASVRYLAFDLGPQGIRVNAVSPGPARTVAAKSIPGFTKMYERTAKTVPLRKLQDHDDVGNMSMFLLSDLAKGTTGETIYVDGGYHIMGMSLDSE